jgi:hypothetical protein
MSGSSSIRCLIHPNSSPHQLSGLTWKLILEYQLLPDLVRSRAPQKRLESATSNWVLFVGPEWAMQDVDTSAVRRTACRWVWRWSAPIQCSVHFINISSRPVHVADTSAKIKFPSNSALVVKLYYTWSAYLFAFELRWRNSVWKTIDIWNDACSG